MIDVRRVWITAAIVLFPVAAPGAGPIAVPPSDREVPDRADAVAAADRDRDLVPLPVVVPDPDPDARATPGPVIIRVPDPDRSARPPMAPASVLDQHREAAASGRRSSQSLGFFFVIGAIGAVAGAFVTIAARTPMRSVLGFLLTVLSTAGLYLLLRAQLLAAIQVIVYAGAVVVLFAFVIMFLRQWALPGPGERWLPVRYLAAFGLVYFAYLALPELWEVGPGSRTPLVRGFGATAGLGDDLFTTYLVPFEAISVLLLTAIVGAVAVARGRDRPLPPSGERGGEAGDA